MHGLPLQMEASVLIRVVARGSPDRRSPNVSRTELDECALAQTALLFYDSGTLPPCNAAGLASTVPWFVTIPDLLC